MHRWENMPLALLTLWPHQQLYCRSAAILGAKQVVPPKL